MKKFILILLFAFASVQADYPVDEGYSYSDLGEISPDSYVYPGYMLIQAFKDNKPWEALKYCTEEALVDADLSGKTFYYILKYNSVAFKNLENTEVTIRSRAEGVVSVSYFGDDSIAHEKAVSARFRVTVEKVDGKYMITEIR
ncbi:hypothetical protein LNTAR_22944 [Lentisphaera araneosa HTCC2155]|uniref:Uncharacterized protein n=1 Tax=Lentisphaera araneosa HTCC2155 TaxID=313628 RepID=A6DGI0_9BACT|nr:hypothetical protein [Lentisphaera araneosa]EDM29297.1 hypothetical protein LNTAR_22944 [Lentisphaera araneosa HTCC2155]